MDPQVTCVLDAKALIGESPVWSPEEQALYWVDIPGQTLNRFDPRTGASRTWPMPEPVGSFAFRESGGLILAVRAGFATFDPDLAEDELSLDGSPQAGPGLERVSAFLDEVRQMAENNNPQLRAAVEALREVDRRRTEFIRLLSEAEATGDADKIKAQLEKAGAKVELK